MDRLEVFTGIFKYEFAISLLNCCMTIIVNVFEDMYKVCKSRNMTKEQLKLNYSKLVKQIMSWSDELYEKEVLNCLSIHPYFQDVVERSFIAWVKSFYKNTNKKIQVKQLSVRFFSHKFIELSSNVWEISELTFFSFSLIEKKDICMKIIRDVFHLCEDFIIILDENESSVVQDEIMPSDSISNVCLDYENTTSFPPDLNTVPAATKGSIVGSM